MIPSWRLLGQVLRNHPRRCVVSHRSGGQPADEAANLAPQLTTLAGRPGRISRSGRLAGRLRAGSFGPPPRLFGRTRSGCRGIRPPDVCDSSALRRGEPGERAGDLARNASRRPGWRASRRILQLYEGTRLTQTEGRLKARLRRPSRGSGPRESGSSSKEWLDGNAGDAKYAPPSASAGTPRRGQSFF